MKDAAKNYSILLPASKAGRLVYNRDGILRQPEAIKELFQPSKFEMGMIEIARIMEDETFVVKNFRDELFELGVTGKP